MERAGDVRTFAHRAALASGNLDTAMDHEEWLQAKLLEQPSEVKHDSSDFIEGALAHMKGLRLAVEGDLDHAAQALTEADELLQFWGNGQGLLKLYNLAALARIQETLGRRELAARTLATLNQTNPSFAEATRAGKVSVPGV